MRKLVIFCHYNKNNQVENYVLLYLEALKKITHAIQFVSNSPIDSVGRIKITPWVQNIIVRENHGLDFAAWKQVLYTLGFEYIHKNYDELILVNDSCYAPYAAFEPLFQKMSAQPCDMWGITENIGAKHYCNNGNIIPLPPHLQSYFLVFKKSILVHPVFMDFWRAVDDFATRDTVVAAYEGRLTQCLRAQSFNCAAAFPALPEDAKKIQKRYGRPLYDLSICYWDVLLERGSPVLKIKAIRELFTVRITTLLTLKVIELRSLQKKWQALSHTTPFYTAHAHLTKTSDIYSAYQLSFLKKIASLIQHALQRDAAASMQRWAGYKKRIIKYIRGGIKKK